MVQEQLTDYISSQTKLGVSRDAIKSALVSAGWVAGDVEDTLKKVGAGPAAMPAGAMSTGVAVGAKPAQSSPMASTNSSASPQTIKMSDLISSPFSGSSAKPTSAASATTISASAAAATASKFGGTIKGNTFSASPAGTAVAAPHDSMEKSGHGIGTLVIEIIGIVIILGLGGLAWYFYSGNAALAAKVASLNTQSASVTSQLATLQSQLTASSTADASQISNLTAANADLALNLSFYAIPLGTPTATAATPLPVTISGSLSGGGKVPYSILTPRGAKIFITNSSDATVGPELKASVGQTAQLSGTYIQGSDEMTVSSVATTTTQ